MSTSLLGLYSYLTQQEACLLNIKKGIQDLAFCMELTLMYTLHFTSGLSLAENPSIHSFTSPVLSFQEVMPVPQKLSYHSVVLKPC